MYERRAHIIFNSLVPVQIENRYGFCVWRTVWVLFFAQTDTESRLTMRYHTPVCVVVVAFFFSFPFCSLLLFQSVCVFAFCLRSRSSFYSYGCAVRCVLLGSALLSLLSNVPLDVAAVLCVLTVCRQSIKYKTSLVGDEHIIRASKHVDCVRVWVQPEEHKQTTRDSYRWDSCARNNYAHAKMLDFWVGLYNCARY